METSMIEKINCILESTGSTFRTDDGRTMIGHCGGLVFLRKSFDSAEKCLEFVQGAAEYGQTVQKNNGEEWDRAVDIVGYDVSKN